MKNNMKNYYETSDGRREKRNAEIREKASEIADRALSDRYFIGGYRGRVAYALANAGIDPSHPALSPLFWIGVSFRERRLELRRLDQYY